VFAFHENGRLDEYRYLVFATHGVLPGEIDAITQPALVLSYPEQEGYLTMADVFQLKCNADLISLSACNTGMGEYQANEGVIGLTRSFMFAGTSAVTVTLWSVESQSAKELNVGLFEHLAAGQSPAQALQAAKLNLLRGEKGEHYRHPYYWAPFVLFGDGQ
jgi:CHAT domain-containing protein